MSCGEDLLWSLSLGEGLDLHQQPAVALAGHRQAGIAHKFRLAMMTGGVDLSGSPGGVTSATHGEAELEDTVEALRNTVRMLKQEGEI